MIPKPAKGICSTVLLILTIILAVASIPSATSQQFTTSTSFLTSSFAQTSIEYYMSTWTSTVTTTLFAVPFSVPAPAQLTCYYDYDTVFLTGGQQVTLELTASPQVLFYIMTSGQYNAWLLGYQAARRNCVSLAPSGQGAYLFHPPQPVSSYTTSWTPPSDGTYDLVFWNPVGYDVSGSLVLSQQPTYTYTNEFQSTHYYSEISTQTVQTVQTVLAAPNWFTFSNLTLFVFLAAVGAGFVIFLIWNHGRPRRRSRSSLLTDYIAPESTSKTTTRQKAETAPKTEKSQPEKAFCVNCGNELPADWKFCRHCGTKQPS